MNVRDHWRIVALVVLVSVSLVVLFVPGMGLGETAFEEAAVEDGVTNLQFGLELAGGTRIRAPVIGMTAEEVEVTVENQADLERAIADELEGVTRGDVQARPETGTVEVFAFEDTEAFERALGAAGVEYDHVRLGVTEPTRQEIMTILRTKIDESGLAGGVVRQVTTLGGETFIVIEVPQSNRTQVEALIAERGHVEIVANYPGGDGPEQQTVLTQDEIATVGTASGPTEGIARPHVPVVLTADGADRFAQDMITLGFTQEGRQACPPGAPDDPGGHCLYTVLDGEVVYAASMSSGLAASIENSDFVARQNFVMTTTNMSDARALQVNLRAGALPAPLDLGERGTSSFIAPSLAEEFKIYSLLTGLIAVFAVAGTVFIRYGEPKVAVPMIVTALSEVVILLGFAAAVGLALDLAHIAGLIAVIGTGVDDLIIIADGVMAREVRSDRVFRSRFRKAFWVIGVAAATTIIAMSPLAVLSLGDLRGFAIVTILGVLIGVIITRPAYADILRILMTSKKKK